MARSSSAKPVKQASVLNRWLGFWVFLTVFLVLCFIDPNRMREVFDLIGYGGGALGGALFMVVICVVMFLILFGG